MVHDGGFSCSPSTAERTASLAVATAVVRARAAAASHASRVPAPRGSGWSRTARAARAAASEAMWESVAIDTPSQTTSTARLPGASVAVSAIASSLRACRRPMSHTPPTHGAGDSAKWLRGSGGGDPQWSQ